MNVQSFPSPFDDRENFREVERNGCIACEPLANTSAYKHLVMGPTAQLLRERAASKSEDIRRWVNIVHLGAVISIYRVQLGFCKEISCAVKTSLINAFPHSGSFVYKRIDSADRTRAWLYTREVASHPFTSTRCL